VFPISAFVAAGFEYSVANMYFIPIGLLIKTDSLFLAAIGKGAADYANLTWTNFFIVNLLPVTLGNLIGGVILVGLVYWFIYLRPEGKAVVVAAQPQSSLCNIRPRATRLCKLWTGKKRSR
jgi:formate transporter